MSFALPNGSAHADRVLRGLHPSIIVVRCPQRAWSTGVRTLCVSVCASSKPCNDLMPTRSIELWVWDPCLGVGALSQCRDPLMLAKILEQWDLFSSCQIWCFIPVLCFTEVHEKCTAFVTCSLCVCCFFTEALWFFHACCLTICCPWLCGPTMQTVRGATSLAVSSLRKIPRLRSFAQLRAFLNPA